MAGQEKVLRTHVHVFKPGKGGGWKILEAGQKLEAWAAKLITNEKAFQTVDADTEPAPAAPASTPATGAAAASTDASAGAPAAPVDPGTLTLEQLQEQLKAAELPVDGTQEQLVARLRQFQAEQAAQKQA